jgi:hypothetical protein
MKIAPGLDLPEKDAAPNTFAVLAVRGAGKTNTARVMAEEFHAAGLPFVAVDPVGSWWGLRSAGDGGPGLPIPIFGGKHGDVPLERGSGVMIADLIAEKRLSCVLDCSKFSEGDKTHFLTEFADQLFRRNTEQLHLFLEEADDYIPQKPFREQARCLRAFENIVRRGRARGLGMTLITQRSAVLNKNVLTQVGTLIVMRTTSPQDRKAVEAWIQYHAGSGEVLKSLPSLKDGEAWVWSPQWLGLVEPKRVKVRLAHTFDSGATPGRRGRKAATLADVDLGAITKAMAATIERAKAEDPRELRKRIGELGRELAAAKNAAPGPAAPDKAALERAREAGRIEVRRFFHRHISNVETGLNRFRIDAAKLAKGLSDWSPLQGLADEPAASALPTPRPVPEKRPVIETRSPARPRNVNANEPVTTNGVSQRILNALAELELLGAREPERELVAFLAGYTHLQSKGFVNAMSSLRTSGLVDYPTSGTVRLTGDGRDQASYPAEPRSPNEVQERVIALLGGASARILKPLIDAYPNALPREEVARAANYGHLQSKGFVNAMSRLRSLGFIDYPDRGSAIAKPILFLES